MTVISDEVATLAKSIDTELANLDKATYALSSCFSKDVERCIDENCSEELYWRLSILKRYNENIIKNLKDINKKASGAMKRIEESF